MSVQNTIQNITLRQFAQKKSSSIKVTIACGDNITKLPLTVWG